jgi:hypothetical protein
MLVFTVMFGRLAGLPSEGTAPYPLMVFAGMLPWTFFATGLPRHPTASSIMQTDQQGLLPSAIYVLAASFVRLGVGPDPKEEGVA